MNNRKQSANKKKLSDHLTKIIRNAIRRCNEKHNLDESINRPNICLTPQNSNSQIQFEHQQEIQTETQMIHLSNEQRDDNELIQTEKSCLKINPIKIDSVQKRKQKRQTIINKEKDKRSKKNIRKKIRRTNRIPEGHIFSKEFEINSQQVKGYYCEINYYNNKMLFGPYISEEIATKVRDSCRQNLLKLPFPKSGISSRRRVVNTFYAYFRTKIKSEYEMLTIK